MKRNVFIICSFILSLVLSFSAKADIPLIIDWDQNGESNSYVSSSLSASYGSDCITISGHGSELNVWALDLTGYDYISFDVLAFDTNTTSVVPTITVSDREYIYTGSIVLVTGIRTTYKLYFKDFLYLGETFEPSSDTSLRFKFESSNYCDLTIGDVYGGIDGIDIPEKSTVPGVPPPTYPDITKNTTTTTSEVLTVDDIAGAGFGVLDHILGFISVVIPVAIIIIGIFIGIKYAIDFFKGGTK